MTSPLTVMPLATAASRAVSDRAPLLLGPSPETSITRRVPSMPFPSNSWAAYSIAPLIEVAERNTRGAAASRSAKLRAVAASRMTSQSTSVVCSVALDHST